MTRIVWDQSGDRYFESGVDRGVLYVEDNIGIAWNGLLSVVESPSSGDPESYYFDGVNYLTTAPAEVFEATLSAFFSPPEFDACDGAFSLSTGLLVTQQNRKTFGLSYRTLVGNDTSTDYTAKIHIVYNALAYPTQRRYATINSRVDPLALDWRLRAKPVSVKSMAPSAHIIIDTAKTLPETLALLEDILYGTDTQAPRLPDPEEILNLFEVGLLTYTETRLTSPNRSLLEGVWGTAMLTDDARTVYLTRPTWSNRQYIQYDVPLVDDFSRVRSGTGWGIATAGGAWNHLGGTVPDDYSVNSGIAELAIDSSLVTRHCDIGSYDLTYQTVSAKFSVDERASEDGGYAFGVTFARIDNVNHYRAKMDINNPNLKDTFSRVSSSGWGTMTSGDAWSISGGTSTDYTVDGSVGKLTMSAKNSSRRVFSGSATDVEVLAKVAPSEVATGGSYTIAAMLHYQNASNQYLARLEFKTTGVVVLKLQKNEDGEVTDISTDTSLTDDTYTAGTWFWIHAKISDGVITVSAWKDGGTEPESWMVSVTDVSLAAAGAVGFRAYAFSSNTNPDTVNVTVDDFETTVGDGKDIVTAVLQKQDGGSFTDFASTVVGTTEPGDVWNIEGRKNDQDVEMRVWREGYYHPGVPTVATTDNTFASGRSGVFAFIKTDETAKTVSVSNFYASGTVVDPPSVVIPGRVYCLEDPFDGSTIDKFELWDMIKGESEDLLDIAMHFISGATDVYDAQGNRVRGDAHYGPRDTDGSLIEGSDFNDYMGVTWTYPDSGDDEPEAAQINSLDCSGFVRMCFGPVGLGLPVRISGNDGDAIPRVSYNQMDAASPGIVVIADTGTQPTDLTGLQIGDVVGFDADSGGYPSGQIDHVGIYIGQDGSGNYLFISSRKTNDGPTFSITGGSSKLNGTGFYATAFRVAKRF